jgi:hypothetical protein
MKAGVNVSRRGLGLGVSLGDEVLSAALVARSGSQWLVKDRILLAERDA